jgi:hypothetical protein
MHATNLNFFLVKIHQIAYPKVHSRQSLFCSIRNLAKINQNLVRENINGDIKKST